MLLKDRSHLRVLQQKDQRNEQLEMQNVELQSQAMHAIEQKNCEVQQVIQQSEVEKNMIRTEAQQVIQAKDEQVAVIQQSKIESELMSNQDKDTIATMRRQFVNSTEDIRLRLLAEHQQTMDTVVAQNQQFESRQFESNKELFALRGQVQKLSNATPALQFGPSFDSRMDEN